MEPEPVDTGVGTHSSGSSLRRPPPQAWSLPVRPYLGFSGLIEGVCPYPHDPVVCHGRRHGDPVLVCPTRDLRSTRKNIQL